MTPPTVAIVSTSIYRAPPSYIKWAQQGDLLVAGDVNSHRDLRRYVETVGGEYLDPSAQREWPFSDAIGWRSVQRRNAALMTAYARGYDYVVTVDDDNMPTDDWVQRHVEHLRGHVPSNTMVARGDGAWVDTGKFVRPPHRQRGTPNGAVGTHVLTKLDGHVIVVSTAQVLGDPDCDAVTRITSAPRVEEVTLNVVVDLRNYAAFNSQATLWAGSWAPLLAVIPHVGRYDDIIASFVAKRIMMARGVTFYAGEPCVTQDRNRHDFIADLRNELYGMDATPHLVRCLDDVHIEPDDPLPLAYDKCVSALARSHILNPQALEFMWLWHKTWVRLQRDEDR